MHSVGVSLHVCHGPIGLVARSLVAPIVGNASMASSAVDFVATLCCNSLWGPVAANWRKIFFQNSILH